jgi:hypothetical protein
MASAKRTLIRPLDLVGTSDYNDENIYRKDILDTLLKGKALKHYKKIKKYIEPVLNELGYRAYYAPKWREEDGYSISGQEDYFLEEIYGIDHDIYDNSFIFVFNLISGTNKYDNFNKYITIRYSKLSHENKEKVFDVFNKHFKNYYSWNGKNSSIMKILINKSDDNYAILVNEEDMINRKEYIKINMDKSINLFDDHTISRRINKFCESELKEIFDHSGLYDYSYGFGVHDITLSITGITHIQVKDLTKKIKEYILDEIKIDDKNFEISNYNYEDRYEKLK